MRIQPADSRLSAAFRVSRVPREPQTNEEPCQPEDDHVRQRVDQPFGKRAGGRPLRHLDLKSCRQDEVQGSAGVEKCNQHGDQHDAESGKGPQRGMAVIVADGAARAPSGMSQPGCAGHERCGDDRRQREVAVRREIHQADDHAREQLADSKEQGRQSEELDRVGVPAPDCGRGARFAIPVAVLRRDVEMVGPEDQGHEQRPRGANKLRRVDGRTAC